MEHAAPGWNEMWGRAMAKASLASLARRNPSACPSAFAWQKKKPGVATHGAPSPPAFGMASVSHSFFWRATDRKVVQKSLNLKTCWLYSTNKEWAFAQSSLGSPCAISRFETH